MTPSPSTVTGCVPRTSQATEFWISRLRSVWPERQSGALEVAREVDEAAGAVLADDDRGLVRPWDRGVGELGRIGRVRRHDRQHQLARRLDRQPVGTSRDQVRVVEAREDLMGALDPRIEAVPVGAGHGPGRLDAEEVGQPRLVPAPAVLVEHRGLERGHQRAARGHVVAQLPALGVAQPRDVGQQERGVPADRLRARGRPRGRSRTGSGPRGGRSRGRP